MFVFPSHVERIDHEFEVIVALRIVDLRADWRNHWELDHVAEPKHADIRNDPRHERLVSAS